MSVCVGDSASAGAAFFAAPGCARDIVQRQRWGVNDPGIAPPKPPRCGPGVVHAPLSLSVSPARVAAEWRRRSAFDLHANVPRIVMWITLSTRWLFCGAHASCFCG
jgi:hypothetical protein